MNLNIGKEVVKREYQEEILDSLAGLGVGAAILRMQKSVPKLYEIYTLSVLLRALDTLGAKLEARTAKDTRTSELRFRFGPGYIYSPTSASGFVFTEYQDRTYEVQNGVKVLGDSGVLHELDVFMIDREAAERCRRGRYHPRWQDVRYLAECKFYGSTLDLSLGREFAGLVGEFPPERPLKLWLFPSRRRIAVFLSNQQNQSVRTVIEHSKGCVRFGLSPQNRQGVEQYIVWLTQQLPRVLA